VLLISAKSVLQNSFEYGQIAQTISVHSPQIPRNHCGNIKMDEEADLALLVSYSATMSKSYLTSRTSTC
jgi:hypothetical protein